MRHVNVGRSRWVRRFAARAELFSAARRSSRPFSQLKRAWAVPPFGAVICTTALALPGTGAGAVPVS
ncbi:hypothetical protein RHODGE_RHODGE_01479 [Rhodoplanes serenus]|uniref:Uncharacterized protein n=1 Tax=Rhodoplanes serenus TaxID=200615 RepID=A0A447CSS5_9BRAD|nr:hypothetical protein RHODGE_RHODGE_01479 [Rhodoplanes serenus]